MSAALPTVSQDRPPARAWRPAQRRGRGRAAITTRRAAWRVVWLAVLAIFTVFFVLPAVWLLLAPTKTDSQLVSSNPLAFGSLATVGQTFRQLLSFDSGAILTWMGNSAIYSFGALALTLVAAIPAGYGLARTQFIGRRLLLSITLIVMMMPSTALVLPLFLEMSEARLIDSPLSVILPMSFFPFGVYLTYIYFSSSVPLTLLEAARLDGCSEFAVFRRIAVPLAKPVIALVAFFGFVANWNNFFLPYVMLPESSRYPLQVGLQNLLASAPAFNPSAGGNELAVYRPELALAALLTCAPVLIVFLFAQRALVTGMMSGANRLPRPEDAGSRAKGPLSTAGWHEIPGRSETSAPETNQREVVTEHVLLQRRSTWPGGPCPASPAQPPEPGVPGTRPPGLGRRAGGRGFGHRLSGGQVIAPRPLPRSGLVLSPLGLGTAALGVLRGPEAAGQAAEAVRLALASGMSYIDTAPLYGIGAAERRVGAGLAGQSRDQFVLSTKVGRIIDEQARTESFDFSVAAVTASLEGSLERLGLAQADVVYVHDPDDAEAAARESAFPALRRMRANGTVRAIGAGMNQAAMLERFVSDPALEVDVVLLAGRYTLLDQSGLGLLNRCRERGIGVVIGQVFNSGILVNPRPGAHYNHRPASEPLVERARALARVCERYGVPLATVALQFGWGHPAVVSVLNGAGNLAEMAVNLEHAATEIPAACWEQLRSEGLLPPEVPVPGEG